MVGSQGDDLGQVLGMRRVLIALLLLLLLLAGAAGALLWRVSRAPLSLAFLQPTLQAMIDRGAPFHVRFVDPSLVWDREENTLALQVRDVSARTDEGRLVVSAPLLRGTVSATSLILQQRVELVSVNVELPEIGLEWKADKRLALRMEKVK